MGRMLSIALVFGLAGVPLASWLLRKENFTKLETLLMGYTLGFVGIPAIFFLELVAGLHYDPKFIPINWILLFVAGLALWAKDKLASKDGFRNFLRMPPIDSASITGALPSLALLVIILLAVWIPLTVSGGLISEIDPYFYLEGVHQLVQMGYNPPVDDTAWYPLLISGHLGQPFFKFVLAPWYSLYAGSQPYSPYTIVASSSIYPPIALGLTVFFAYLLFRQLYSPRIGLLAGGLFAFTPTILSYFQGGRSQLVPYGIFALFFFLAMFFLMVKRRNLGFAALSVLAYAAIIFGSNLEVLLLFCLPLLLGSIGLLHVLSPTDESRELNRILLVFLAGVAAVQLLNMAYNSISIGLLLEAIKNTSLPALALAVPLAFEWMAERQKWKLTNIQRVEVLAGAVVVIALLAPSLPGLSVLLHAYQFLGSYAYALTRTISEQALGPTSFDGSLGQLGMTLDPQAVGPRMAEALAAGAGGVVDGLFKFRFVDALLSLLAFVNVIPTMLFNVFYNSVSGLLNTYLSSEGVAANFASQERVNSLATMFFFWGPALLVLKLASSWRAKGSPDRGVLMLLAFLLPVTYMGLMKAKFAIYLSVTFAASAAAFIGEAEPLVHGWAVKRKIIKHAALAEHPAGNPSTHSASHPAHASASHAPSGTVSLAGWDVPAYTLAWLAVAVLVLLQMGWPASALMDRGWAISPAYTFAGSVLSSASTPTFAQNPTRGLALLSQICKDGTYPAACAAVNNPNATLSNPLQFYRSDYCAYSLWPHPTQTAPPSLQQVFSYRCGQLTSYWVEAMQWMSQNVPHKDRVTSWWDYGHWTNFLGGANTVLRPEQSSLEMIGRVANALLHNDTANLRKVMKSYDSRWVLIDSEIIGGFGQSGFQFGGKYSALNYLGCDWAKQTSVQNGPSTSQCEMDHQPEQMDIPLSAAEGRPCTISESTQAQGVVANRIRLVAAPDGGRPNVESKAVYCVRQITGPDGQPMLDVYLLDQRNAAGDLVHSPAFVWVQQPATLPQFYSSSQTLPFFAAFYAPTPWTDVNGTVRSAWDSRVGPFYDSPLYQGFFLNQLEGFDLVFNTQNIRIYRMTDEYWNKKE
jgi:asparagine N-glycosylation enzyme membrane subunit Stt3